MEKDNQVKTMGLGVLGGESNVNEGTSGSCGPMGLRGRARGRTLQVGTPSTDYCKTAL